MSDVNLRKNHSSRSISSPLDAPYLQMPFSSSANFLMKVRRMCYACTTYACKMCANNVAEIDHRPTLVFPTAFPAGNRRLIPGLANSSRVPAFGFRKLYKGNPYDFDKSSEGPKAVSGLEKPIVVKPYKEVNHQMGFGSVETGDEGSDNSDIDFKSADNVDPDILNAFEHPVINIQRASFTPKDKKVETPMKLSDALKRKSSTPMSKQKISKLKLV